MKIRIDIKCDGASAPQIQTTTSACAHRDNHDGGPAPALCASGGLSPVSFATLPENEPAVPGALSAGAAPKPR